MAAVEDKNHAAVFEAVNMPLSHDAEVEIVFLTGSGTISSRASIRSQTVSSSKSSMSSIILIGYLNLSSSEIVEHLDPIQANCTVRECFCRARTGPRARLSQAPERRLFLRVDEDLTNGGRGREEAPLCPRPNRPVLFGFFKIATSHPRINTPPLTLRIIVGLLTNTRMTSKRAE